MSGNIGSENAAISEVGAGGGARDAAHLFETVGKQVEGLSLHAGNAVLDDSAGVQVVEKIESLCMSCHEDVRSIMAHSRTTSS